MPLATSRLPPCTVLSSVVVRARMALGALEAGVRRGLEGVIGAFYAARPPRPPAFRMSTVLGLRPGSKRYDTRRTVAALGPVGYAAVHVARPPHVRAHRRSGGHRAVAIHRFDPAVE